MLVLANGEPYIPNGFYLEWNRWQVGGENFTIAMFQEVANGFNTPLPYRSGTPQQMVDTGYLEFLENMDKMGMKVHMNMYGTGMEQPSAEKTRTLTEYVNLVKDSPALLAYYIADEPDGQGTDPTWIKDTYDIVKRLDPYHPISIVLNCMVNPIHDIFDYIDFGDIIMSDPYPIGLRNPVGCDTCEGNVLDVAKRAEQYMRDINGEKPFWMVPQTFGGEQHWDRQPTAREVRVMTYLSFILGATGIQYFTLGAFLPDYNQGIHWEPKDHMWAEARKVALEIAQITPALYSLDIPPTLEILTNGIYARALQENGKGVITIFMANPDNFPKVLSLRMALPGGYSSIGEVLFEQRASQISDDGFINDMVDAYGTRVFRFYSFGYLQSLQELRENNLILNPSFELQNHVGFPDSYLIRYGNGGNVLSDSSTSITGYNSLRLIHPGQIIHRPNSSSSSSSSTSTSSSSSQLQSHLNSKTSSHKDDSDELLIAGIDSFLGSKVVGNNTYIASIYAKGSQAGLIGEFSCSCFNNGGSVLRISLETVWTRYEIIDTPIQSALCSLRFFLLEQGTAWIDSLSLRLFAKNE